jgi:hypothetical protein
MIQYDLLDDLEVDSLENGEPLKTLPTSLSYKSLAETDPLWVFCFSLRATVFASHLSRNEGGALYIPVAPPHFSSTLTSTMDFSAVSRASRDLNCVCEWS